MQDKQASEGRIYQAGVFTAGPIGGDQKPDYDVSRIFTYHPPRPGQAERYEYLRSVAKCLAQAILVTCPASRERSLALTKVEEAVMWANASIARNE